MLRYCFMACVFGGGWFAILLIPSMTRQWLMENAPQHLGCLVGASVIVAVTCREFIAAATELWDHLFRAVVIPYLGCLVFLILEAALLWIKYFLYGGLANFHDTLSLFIMGMVAAVLSCFVVIPYGLLCQYLMSAAADAMITRR